MSKQDEKLEKTEINALDDNDLEKATGGDKVTLQHEKVTGGTTAPTETITFEYGGLMIRYGQQN